MGPAFSGFGRMYLSEINARSLFTISQNFAFASPTLERVTKIKLLHLNMRDLQPFNSFKCDYGKSVTRRVTCLYFIDFQT